MEERDGPRGLEGVILARYSYPLPHNVYYTSLPLFLLETRGTEYLQLRDKKREAP